MATIIICYLDHLSRRHNVKMCTKRALRHWQRWKSEFLRTIDFRESNVFDKNQYNVLINETQKEKVNIFHFQNSKDTYQNLIFIITSDASRKWYAQNTLILSSLNGNLGLRLPH